LNSSLSIFYNKRVTINLFTAFFFVEFIENIITHISTTSTFLHFTTRQILSSSFHRSYFFSFDLKLQLLFFSLSSNLFCIIVNKKSVVFKLFSFPFKPEQFFVMFHSLSLFLKLICGNWSRCGINPFYHRIFCVVYKIVFTAKLILSACGN
jgi:hypothetical protein